MKKIFFLSALAMTVCAINAQNNGSCPSWLEFRIPNDIGNANHLEIELWLHNNSQNLNGFNVEISLLDERAQWLIVDEDNNKYFTAAGYGKNILARWEGITDEEREADLEQHCVVESALRSNGDLCIIEVLSTIDCKFFPTTLAEDSYANVYDEGIPVGRFAIDVSNFDNGLYNWGLGVPCCENNKYSFSYTGGVEGTRAWAPDEGLYYPIYKWGEYASFYYIPENYDAINEIDTVKKVTSVKYYNLAGVESAEPFSGVNIEVTTYSDSSTTTKKVLK